MKVFITLLILIFATNILWSFSGEGSGTPDDPYRITTVEQLQEMNDDLAAQYILMNDIDASETREWNDGDGFIGIGFASNVISDFEYEIFSGEFNGNNYTIYNICINNRYQEISGFFNCVGNGAYIHDVNMLDAEIGMKTGCSGNDSFCGLFIGYIINFNSDELNTIENCEVSGSISNDYRGYTGGFCGTAQNSVIKNCRSCVKNESYYDGFGFCWRNGGLIENCELMKYNRPTPFCGYNYGRIRNSKSPYMFCMYNHGFIKNCESIEKEKYDSLTGAGFCYFNLEIIDSCRSEVHLNRASGFGGFCNENAGTIINCHSICTVDSAKSEVALFCHTNGSYMSSPNHDVALIQNCSAEGRINGGSYIAGFCVFSNFYTPFNNVIRECSCKGELSGNKNVSGFCAEIFLDVCTLSEFIDCYSTVNIKSDSIATGFCGNLKPDFYNYNVRNCYWAGKMDCPTDAYGFNNPCQNDTSNISITSCFWDNELSGVDISENATGLPTADMKDINTFLDAGWDFENVWAIDPEINDGYPYLKGKSVVSVQAKELLYDEEFIVYPNPAEDIINVSYLASRKVKSISLFDIKGSMVLNHSASCQSGSFSVSLNDINTGVYILRINTNKGIIKKLVIRR